ncbi:MAG TPA: MBL fold metallo-hydrolase, partial [Micromonospora sp.]
MARPPATELAPGVFRIPTTIGDYVNVFAFRDDDGQVTLVDCGYWNAPKKIVAALRFIGSDPSDVTRILLTHAHGDHAGGLA